jgi:hypothetical protein
MNRTGAAVLIGVFVGGQLSLIAALAFLHDATAIAIVAIGGAIIGGGFGLVIADAGPKVHPPIDAGHAERHRHALTQVSVKRAAMSRRKDEEG